MKKIGVAFLLFLIALIVFHKPLVVVGSRWMVSRWAEGRIISYETLKWEEGSLVLSGLVVKDPSLELTCDRVEVAFSFQWANLLACPKITVIHPEFSVGGASSSSLPFLYSSKWVEPEWQIQHGVLRCASSRFYFSLLSNTFTLAHEPQGPPLLLAEIEKGAVHFQFQEKVLSRLLPLLTLTPFPLPEGWDEISGVIEGSLDYVNRGGAFWEEVSASLSLKGGSGLIHSGLEIANVEAILLFTPQEIPFLSLQGTIFSEGVPFHCKVEGRGGEAEYVPFFAEVSAEVLSSSDHAMQVVLQCHAAEDSSLSCGIDIKEAHQEHIELCRALAGLQGECVGGQASLKATLLYKKGRWEKATIEQLEGSEICWEFPEESLTLFTKEVQGTGVLYANALKELTLHVEGGQYVDPLYTLQEISTDLIIHEGRLFPSQMSALFEELHFQGTLADAPLCLEGDMRGERQGLPLDLHVTCTKQQGFLSAEVTGKVAQDPISATVLFSSPLWSWPQLFWGELPSIDFKEALVKAPKVTLERYNPFLPPFLQEIHVSGSAACEALISPEGVVVQLDTENLDLEYPRVHCKMEHSLVSFSYEYATQQFSCEIPVKQATLTHLPSGVVLEEVETLLHLTQNLVEASDFTFSSEGIVVKGSAILTPSKVLTLQTSSISGSLPSLFSLFHKCALLDEIPSIGGEFYSKQKGFMMTLPLDKSGECQWQFKGGFSEVVFLMNKETSLHQGKGEISIDSTTGLASLNKAEGIWTLQEGRELSIQAKQATFHLFKKEAQFLIKATEGKKEYALVQGRATQLPSLEWEMVLDPQVTHIAGINLQVERLRLNPDFSPGQLEMKPRFTGKQLPGLVSFLKDAGFVRLNPRIFSDLEGVIEARITSQCLSLGFSIHAKSQEFKRRGTPYTPLEWIVHNKDNCWCIEKLTLGPLSLKTTLNEVAKGFSCPQFEANFKGVAMRGSGYFNTESKKLSCQVDSCKAELASLFDFSSGTALASFSLQGDFSEENSPLALSGEATLLLDMAAPLPLSASSKKTLHYTYEENKGLTIEGADFQVKPKQGGVPLAQLKAQTLTLSEENALFLKALQFSITPAALELLTEKNLLPSFFQEIQIEGALQGSGELQFNPSGLSFQGNLEPGRYGMQGISLPFEQFQMTYEKKALSLRAKTQLEDHPLWGSFQCNLSKEPYGVFKLFDHPKAEGLKIAFRSDANGLIIDSIQGSCYGLSCQLTKSIKRKLPLSSVLTGDLKLDFSRLTPLFPEKIRSGLHFLKLGSGYSWQGDLVLWQERDKGFLFSGALVGRECELLGYCFHKIEAALEATPHKFLLSNLKIDDAAGTLGIKKIECHKEGLVWDLYIPQLLAQKLQPSALRKTDISQTSLKPFRIEQFTLSDIRAHLNDLSTLEGTGHLFFSNQFKKETSLFDLPLEMIKKLGLDLSVLTPVQGEFQMELRGDKFYLLSLDHSFSEAERSTFYLAPSKKLSYIDLKGEVHIDLKVQQDVVFKILEPFTLTIRGTLDKPRYGLQF